MRAALLAACAALAAASGPCASSDPVAECQALVALANGLGVKSWKSSSGWLSDKSFCGWHGISCTSSGHVSAIQLKENGLNGTFPNLSAFTELTTFVVDGTRPSSYVGCIDSDFNYSPIHPSLFTLTALQTVSMENACVGGSLPTTSWALPNLVEFSVHQNRIESTFPANFGLSPELQVLKLDRNPIVGSVPAITTCPKLLTFDCNFCALNGTFPDIFGSMPALTEAYWDGNGFTGPLPPSLGQATSLQHLSFDINNLSGEFPAGLCKVSPADCRVGSDTDPTPYQAPYPWVQKVAGNIYSCPLPSCAVKGGACDSSKSPVTCKTAA